MGGISGSFVVLSVPGDIWGSPVALGVPLETPGSGVPGLMGALCLSAGAPRPGRSLGALG